MPPSDVNENRWPRKWSFSEALSQQFGQIRHVNTSSDSSLSSQSGSRLPTPLGGLRRHSLFGRGKDPINYQPNWDKSNEDFNVKSSAGSPISIPSHNRRLSFFKRNANASSCYSPPRIHHRQYSDVEGLHSNSMASFRLPLIRSHTLGILPFDEESWPDTLNRTQTASHHDNDASDFKKPVLPCKSPTRPAMGAFSSSYSSNSQSLSSLARGNKTKTGHATSAFAPGGRSVSPSDFDLKLPAATEEPGEEDQTTPRGLLAPVRGNEGFPFKMLSNERKCVTESSVLETLQSKTKEMKSHALNSKALVALAIDGERTPGEQRHQQPGLPTPSLFPSVDEVISQMTAANLDVVTPSGSRKTLDSFSTRQEKIEAITWSLANDRRYAGMSPPRAGPQLDPQNIGLLRPVRLSDFDDFERLRLYQQSQWNIALARELEGLKAQADQPVQRNLFPVRTSSLPSPGTATQVEDNPNDYFDASAYNGYSGVSTPSFASTDGKDEKETRPEHTIHVKSDPICQTTPSHNLIDALRMNDKAGLHIETPTPKNKTYNRSSSSRILPNSNPPTNPKSFPFYSNTTTLSTHHEITKGTTQLIHTPQLTSYWLGRTIAIEDRLRTAALNGDDSERKWLNNPSERRYASYDILRKFIANDKTADSFEEFVEEWEAKHHNEGRRPPELEERRWLLGRKVDDGARKSSSGYDYDGGEGGVEGGGGGAKEKKGGFSLEKLIGRRR
ncbi:MAG: hypothetical protein Q9190_003353 [Brigantiaea leucoxantha]